MGNVTNGQLKILLDNQLAPMRCAQSDGVFILQICTNNIWHSLISRRGHVREFKSFDAMVNHVSRMTDKPFNISFNGERVNDAR